MKKILNFVETQGRGGLTKAVKKFNVTATTISSWKKKKGDGDVTDKDLISESSKELKALKKLTSLLEEIDATEKHLVNLQKRYAKVKTKL